MSYRLGRSHGLAGSASLVFVSFLVTRGGEMAHGVLSSDRLAVVKAGASPFAALLQPSLPLVGGDASAGGAGGSFGVDCRLLGFLIGRDWDRPGSLSASIGAGADGGLHGGCSLDGFLLRVRGGETSSHSASDWNDIPSASPSLSMAESLLAVTVMFPALLLADTGAFRAGLDLASSPSEKSLLGATLMSPVLLLSAFTARALATSRLGAGGALPWVMRLMSSRAACQSSPCPSLCSIPPRRCTCEDFIIMEIMGCATGAVNIQR